MRQPFRSGGQFSVNATNTLVCTMTTDNDRQHNLRFRDPRAGLTRAAVEAAVTPLIGSQIFNDDIGTFLNFVNAERVEVTDLRILPRGA
ncbi:MAG: DUF2922 domain-containing protein [Defluviitaleaceae bacterium]|nr:DUF2922 domain-containing protein [Defluviitaleaceae bacterium]